LAILLTVSSAPLHAEITCREIAVTQAGGVEDDDFTGTAGDDRIETDGGNDSVIGLAGSDCLNGGSFIDQLFGGDDDDDLRGESGNDLLDGGDGDDYLNGGSENDVMYGGDGNDDLFGEGGDDQLYGGDGDDYLDGGSFNDLLWPGLGFDRVAGQGGDDTIILHAGDVPAGAREIINGGSGFNTVVFDFDPGPLTFTGTSVDVVDPATLGTYRLQAIQAAIIDRCGNGVLGPGEECDDNNRANGDGCDANCTRTRCGNRMVTSGERCDDGNTLDGDGCDAECQREECENGQDENGQCIPDDPNNNNNNNNNQQCSETCDDGDKCTTDRCQSSRCVFTPLPTLDRAICDVNEIRANCSLELGQRQRLEKKLRKVLRILRLVKAGASPSRLARANRIVAKVEKRALRMVLKGKTRVDCSKAIDIRLVDLSAAVTSLQFQ
jgi:cysteine-rich repeat protein